MEKEQYAGIKVNKISPGQLYNRMKTTAPPYILDVRPLGYTMGKPFIPGSIICPLVYLGDRFEKLPKNRPIIVIDWINKKSIIAAKYLLNRGFQVEGVLKGGVMRWQEEKLPLQEKPKGTLGGLQVEEL